MGFMAYFDNSNMDQLPIPKQRNYLNNCLGPQLLLSIVAEADESMKLFGPSPSVFTVLDEYFKRRHPIFNRRSATLVMKQLPGQSREDFFRSVSRSFTNSEMAKLTVDELLVHVIVAGLRDTTTKEKVFEKENVTSSSLLKLLQHLDANAKKLETPRICTVAAGGGGRPGTRPPGRGRGPAALGRSGRPGRSKPGETRRYSRNPNSRVPTNFIPGTDCCVDCGFSLHTSGQCPARGRNCDNCGKPGHFIVVCKSDPAPVPHRPARAALPPRSAPPARGQLRAVRRIDNFVNILPGDEDLEIEEDVLGELSDSDTDEEDVFFPASAEPTSDDDVSVLRMQTSATIRHDFSSTSTIGSTPPPPPCASLTVNLVKAMATPPMDVALSFGGSSSIMHQAVPDSGAGASIISLALVEQHGWPTFPCSIPLQQADGHPLPIRGALYLDVEYRGITISAGCFVSPALKDGLLLSWFHMRDLGLLTDRFPGIETSGDLAKPSISAVLPEDTLDSIKKDFSDVLSDSLATACGRMKGDPVHLELVDNPDVKPCHVKTARQVHIHHRDAAKTLLDELLAAGVIVEVEEWTEWISPAFFVEKPGTSKVRLVTDYRQLNRRVKRPIHPFSPATDLIKRVDPNAKWFCKLDAVHGYFQIPLDEPSSLLTTFLLPYGRYRYTGAPMGLSASSDWFNLETDKAVWDLLFRWLLKIVDDMLVQARTEQELYSRIRMVLQRCREAGITISLRKLECGQSVSFAGYVISSDGIRPDPEKIRAITDFPVPKNASEVRSFLGLANQLAFFIPDVARLSSSIRALLKKGVAYQWLPAQQTSFEALKSILASDMCVRPFDVSLPTEVLTDASRLHSEH